MLNVQLSDTNITVFYYAVDESKNLWVLYYCIKQ